MRRYQPAVTRRMWRFTRDRTQLEELVADVFVQAYQSLESFRGDGPFEHWLLRIATRAGYRFWRNRKRRSDHEVPLQDWDRPGDEEPDRLEVTEAAQQLHQTLAELAPRDRLVLTLMYFEEMSVAQIADQTGWSLSMVKVQAHRARKRLGSLLEKKM